MMNDKLSQLMMNRTDATQPPAPMPDMNAEIDQAVQGVHGAGLSGLPDLWKAPAVAGPGGAPPPPAGGPPQAPAAPLGAPAAMPMHPPMPTPPTPPQPPQEPVMPPPQMNLRMGQ